MRIRKIKSSIMLVLTILFMAACGSTVSSGTVVVKHHENAYTYSTTVCTAYDTNGICKVWMPQTHYVSESWEITIRGTNSEGNNENRTIEVAESTWNEIDYNDHVELDEHGNVKFIGESS